MQKSAKKLDRNTTVLITASSTSRICIYYILQIGGSLSLKFWGLSVEESMFQDTENKSREICYISKQRINSKNERKNWYVVWFRGL